jgi:peptide/nickel transport system ATP-binding protein
MAGDVIVMYLGKIVERADVDTLFHDPKHPYTQALLRSIPRFGQKSTERLATIKGTVPDPSAVPPGCPFHPRCRHRIAGVCDVEDPPVVDVGHGHEVRCVLYRSQPIELIA